MTQKQIFYSDIQKEYLGSETANVLKNHPNCDYYELCQSFLDIALKAPKFKTEDGSLAGVFQHRDINIAKAKAVSFIRRYGITDMDNFFYILEHKYPQSIAPKDTRQKSGLLVEDKCSYKGYVGTFFVFTHISDDVYIKIINEIKAEL